MAYQGIGTGTTPNDNTGDSLFTGAVKINSNFSEIYNALGDGSNINLSKSRTITAGSGLSGGGNLSADITLNIGQGDGISVSADSIAVNNTVIRTSGNQTIDGTLLVTSNIINGGFDFCLGTSDQSTRGNSGSSRALVKDASSTLVLNYAGDFTGGVRIDSSVFAPIYYDINNTGYYLNPASTSSLNSINLNGTLSLNNGSVTSGDALAILNGGDLRLYNSENAGSSRLYCDTNGVINVDGNITTGVFNSTVSTGTAPFTVSSTTKVTNLNVDFLDGIDSSRVVYGDSETKTTLNNNWNAALSSGFYGQYGPDPDENGPDPDGIGTPTETWYHMIGCRHPNTASNYQMQISGELFDVNNLYYRIINNNTPTSWYKIWHSGNMGAGSGLVADSVNIVGAADAGNWFVPLVANSGNQTPVIDSGITYNASSNSLAIIGDISAGGNITNGGFDFLLGTSNQSDRGNSGVSRALVKDASSTLVLNYAGDFTGGVRIDSNVTATTFSGNLANTLTLNTSGTGLTGSTTFNNSGASTFTVTSNATNANTPSTIVARDGSGNFSAGTVTATTFSGNGTIPINGIIMWNGTIAEAIALEPGWALCDGRSVNGKTTPDLRDKFIVGATSGGDNVYPGVGVGQTGGSADSTLVSHSHTGTTGGQSQDHSHSWERQDPQDGAGGRPWPASNNDCILTTVNTGGTSNDHTHNFITSTEGSSTTNKNLPPYYALAFIMRVA
jgi:hypothetical protein